LTSWRTTASATPQRLSAASVAPSEHPARNSNTARWVVIVVVILLFAGWLSYGWNGSGNARSIRSDAQAIPHAKAGAPGCSEWMRVRGELPARYFF
jgi:hypothetical protein